MTKMSAEKRHSAESRALQRKSPRTYRDGVHKRSRSATKVLKNNPFAEYPLSAVHRTILEMFNGDKCPTITKIERLYGCNPSDKQAYLTTYLNSFPFFENYLDPFKKLLKMSPEQARECVGESYDMSASSPSLELASQALSSGSPSEAQNDGTPNSDENPFANLTALLAGDDELELSIGYRSASPNEPVISSDDASIVEDASTSDPIEITRSPNREPTPQSPLSSPIRWGAGMFRPASPNQFLGDEAFPPLFPVLNSSFSPAKN